MTPEQYVEMMRAERDALVVAMASILDIVRRQGGYMKPEDQAQVRFAKALLVEMGVKVKP